MLLLLLLLHFKHVQDRCYDSKFVNLRQTAHSYLGPRIKFDIPNETHVTALSSPNTTTCRVVLERDLSTSIPSSRKRVSRN
jgi:hypothetical protein